MPGFVTQGIGVSIPEENQVIVITSVTVYNHDGEEIGFLNSLTYRAARTVERIRHLNASDAGRILEQVPLPEDYTMDAEGLALYDSTLFGRLMKREDLDTKEVSFAVNSQYGPITLEVYMKHPQSDKEIRVIFGDCWITDFSSPMRIGTPNIVQTCTLQPTWIETELPELADIQG